MPSGDKNDSAQVPFLLEYVNKYTNHYLGYKLWKLVKIERILCKSSLSDVLTICLAITAISMISRVQRQKEDSMATGYMTEGGMMTFSLFSVIVVDGNTTSQTGHCKGTTVSFIFSHGPCKSGGTFPTNLGRVVHRASRQALCGRTTKLILPAPLGVLLP